MNVDLPWQRWFVHQHANDRLTDDRLTVCSLSKHSIGSLLTIVWGGDELTPRWIERSAFDCFTECLSGFTNCSVGNTFHSKY